MYEDELFHYGVKGMKWGRRKARRTARKDAKEYTKAKMYYGEGAGTRRKLIKAKVKQRSTDPYYKAEFDKAVASTDMVKRANKARSERKRADIKKRAGILSRGAGKDLATTGGIGYNTLRGAGGAAVAAYGAYRLNKALGGPSAADMAKRASKSDAAKKVRKQAKKAAGTAKYYKQRRDFSRTFG